MTKSQTENLIANIAADASPVKRLSPPLQRAVFWVAGFAAVMIAAIWLRGNFAEAAARFSDLTVRFEFAGALVTGLTAIIAAFFVSLPDRSKWWLLIPVLPLGFWLMGSGYGCYLHLLESGSSGWALGESGNCIAFILGVSLPSSIALYLALRRSTPLDPVAPLMAGGLGVAGLAAAALQFFHPFQITFLDLGAHIFAVAIVIALLTLFGRRRLAA